MALSRNRRVMTNHRYGTRAKTGHIYNSLGAVSAPSGQSIAQSSEPQLQHYDSAHIHNIDELTPTSLSASSCLSSSADPGLYLFDLPQEVQDMIFDLAYPTIERFKIISKRQWDERVWERRRKNGKNYTRLPFPPPKVSEFLASKQYFLSAARAFISSLPYEVSPYERNILYSNNIINQFITKTTLRLTHLTSLCAHNSIPPNLRYVAVKVSDWDFLEAVSPKLAWEAEFDENDLKAIVRRYKLEAFSGFKEFHIIEQKTHYAKTDEEKAVWESNVRRLEGFIRAIVTKPRQRQAAKSLRHATALYTGSLVSGTGSEVRAMVKRAGRRPLNELQLHDLPNNVEGLMSLLKEHGEDVVDLIMKLKMRERTGSRYYPGT